MTTIPYASLANAEIINNDDDPIDVNLNLAGTPVAGDNPVSTQISGVDYIAGKSGIDASTETIQTIDYAHHEIHSGSTFCVHLTDNKVGKSTEMGCIFKTPAGDKWFHCVYSVDMGAKAIFDILEAPTIDVAPDLTNFYTPRNRNRNSDKISTALSVRVTPVANQVTLILNGDASPISADGTVLHTETIGGAKKGKTASDGHSHEDEYILKADTVYYFRVVGDGSGDDNLQMSMELIWYEHQDKN